MLENRWERINHASFDREGFLQIFEIDACGGELIWPWDKEEKRKGRKRRRRWLCLTYGGEVIWSWEWKNEIKWNGKSWHRTRLDWAEATFAFVNSRLVFFLWTVAAKVDFSTVNSAPVHCLRTHKFHFSATFSLKMDLTALFTHLKIILLLCFQFQFSISAKINSIQRDP